MGEDDIIELLWESGQGFRNTTPSSLPPLPPSILRGSGSGGAEENPEPTAPIHNQNLLIQEDEMVSWLHPSYSQPLYSSFPPLSPPLLSSVLRGSGSGGAEENPQPTAPMHNQNLFIQEDESWLHPSYSQPLYSASPLLPPSVLGGSGSGGAEENPQPTSPMHNQNLFIQEDEMVSWLYSSYRQDNFCSQPLYSSTPQSSISPIAPYDQSVTARRPENVMNFSWLRGTLNSDAGRVEVGQSQPAAQIELADKRKRKEREETIAEIKGTEEAHGSTSRKKSRVAETCAKASIVDDDVVGYQKYLQNQMQFMPQMYMPMPMGMFGMYRPPFTPLPWQHHILGLSPLYPVPTPLPHFPAYMYPHYQFVGLQQRPPPVQRQTSGIKKLEDHDKKSKG